MPTVLPQLPTGIAPFIDPLILSRLPLLNSAANNMACVQQSFMQKQFLPIYRNNFLSQVIKIFNDLKWPQMTLITTGLCRMVNKNYRGANNLEAPGNPRVLDYETFCLWRRFCNIYRTWPFVYRSSDRKWPRLRLNHAYFFRLTLYLV